MGNKPKPDDRRDNVDKIQFNIDNTIENYRLAKEMINKTDDVSTKRDLIEKNKRRKESLENMKNEIKDEAKAKHNDYK
ncbi:MAG: small acid-soluble spore protein Tlp [Tissierellaceae bacterium]|nr:small acid-soluble spore protein Tlp [Tissierellaceae bacterium]